MSLNITSNIQDLQNKSWEDFVSKHPEGSIFQTPDIVNFYSSVNNHEPVVISALMEKKIIGTLVAVIQKESLGYISSRTIVYGGPLVASDIKNKEEVISQLLKELINKVKRKSIYIQFRNFADWSEYKDIFIQNGFKFVEWLNYKVTIDSTTEIKNKISKSKIRQINKGIKSGVKISAPENIEQLKTFYSILQKLYKNKVKKPLPKWQFFENFYTQSLNKKLGTYRLVIYENKVIGGIMIPETKNKAAFEWYVCGLDEEYKYQYPSVMATWAAIQYAVENKLKVFDFMGAGSPDNIYGVREFKSKFGGKQVNYGRFERINNRPVYHLLKFGLQLFSPVLDIFR